MENKLIRIIFAICCLILLIYAYMNETHKVYSLGDPDEVTDYNAETFTETTTFDGLMRKDGKLYDIYSLTPGILQEKDCAT